jgi:aminopeptidase N/puromycin-sensitive aminopeptidase
MTRLVTPLHYSLSLDPLLEERRFSGEVSIEVAVEGRPSRVILDASGLEIVEATIDGVRAAFDTAGDRLSILSAAPLPGPRATLWIAFRGEMHREGRGFFMSGACAVTQLQPVYARSLFPCFDDPAHKTTFDLTVSASLRDTVVANAPLLRDEIHGDRRRMTFATSAKIPPHLLGMAVGPFHVSALAGNPPLRFFTLQPDGGEASVLEAVLQFVRFYESLLGVPYPWPKLDLVAVPQFEAAGIETTSLLLFRESAVLPGAGATPQQHRQRASLVAHELAHQWFGSLVTPASWEDLWLSEGFATWLAAKAVPAGGEHDEVPDVRAIRAAMAADSLPSSRSLRTSGRSAGELHELYDDITYWKGAAVLRMIEAWLGEETFRRGVTRYLTRHAGGHAASTDLWRALEEAAGQPVGSLVETLIGQPGVPALHFSWSGHTIRITQRGNAAGTVPVFVVAGLANGLVARRQIVAGTDPSTLEMPHTVKWVFGNAGSAGYYRCTYDDARAIPADALSGAEVATLLADAWDDLWRGAVDVIAYLDIVERLRGRQAIAGIAASHLADLRQLLAGGPRDEAFAAWIAAAFPSAGESGRDRRSQNDPASAATITDDEILNHFEEHLGNQDTRALAWAHLKAHWEELGPRVVSFGGRGAIAALAAVSDRKTRDDIAGFFATRTAAGAERTLRQTLERIDGRIRFREREQLMFDAWLTRRSYPSFVPEPSLRHVHALLNTLAAGFHGALVHRSWLEGLGLPVPSWMQPPADLGHVVTALDHRTVAVFRGSAVVDAPLFALAKRLEEDLRASADLAERLLAEGPQSADEAAKGLGAVLARQAATFERTLRGAITFADLFGDGGAARVLRTRLLAADGDRARIRRLLDDVASGNARNEFGRALMNECTSLPSVQRAEAAGVAALVNAAAANLPRPTERDS